METKFFHDEFIKAIHRAVPSRPELVKEVSRILRIEKEPASRRINGNVNFSVDEMAALAREFNISIDSLIQSHKHMEWAPFRLESSLSLRSIDLLLGEIDDYIDKVRVICSSPADFGYVLNSLSLGLMLNFPNILKLSFFKWGHYFVDSDEFSDYASWELPPRIIEIKEKFGTFCNANPLAITYVWDDSLIWTLSREVEYLWMMHVVDNESKEVIRKELHEMLDATEAFIKKIKPIQSKGDTDVSFYISNIHLNVGCIYHMSSKGQMALVHTPFARSAIMTDYEKCTSVKEWCISARAISTLISGSGQKERRLFFERQHNIVDTLLNHSKPWA